jgi:hypothetical protein
MSCVVRRQAIAQGAKHDAEDMPRQLAVWPDLLGNIIQPDVRRLQRFVENVQSGCAHLRLQGKDSVSLEPRAEPMVPWSGRQLVESRPCPPLSQVIAPRPDAPASQP